MKKISALISMMMVSAAASAGGTAAPIPEPNVLTLLIAGVVVALIANKIRRK